jgi:hypothetical protein
LIEVGLLGGRLPRLEHLAAGKDIGGRKRNAATLTWVRQFRHARLSGYAISQNETMSVDFAV